MAEILKEETIGVEEKNDHPTKIMKKRTEEKIKDGVESSIKDQISAAVTESLKTKKPINVVSKIIPNNTDDSVSIEQMFLAQVSTPQVGVRRSTADDGKLLFTFKDVMNTSHALARLMRMILYTYGVTHAEFDEKHAAFAESAGFLNIQINYNRNNIKKAMFKSKLTYQMFEQIILVIMGFGLSDIAVKLVEPKSGDVVEFSLTQILKKAQEEFGDTATPIFVENNGEYQYTVSEDKID